MMLGISLSVNTKYSLTYSYCKIPLPCPLLTNVLWRCYYVLKLQPSKCRNGQGVPIRYSYYCYFKVSCRLHVCNYTVHLLLFLLQPTNTQYHNSISLIGDDTLIWRRKRYIALCGGIVLEEALDLSSDRILNEWMGISWYNIYFYMFRHFYIIIRDTDTDRP